MTIPARRDPAAEALQLAAIRMQEGIHRGFDIVFRENDAANPWQWDEIRGVRFGFAKTSTAARRAVDELLSKETRV